MCGWCNVCAGCITRTLVVRPKMLLLFLVYLVSSRVLCNKEKGCARVDVSSFVKVQVLAKEVAM